MAQQRSDFFLLGGRGGGMFMYLLFEKAPCYIAQAGLELELFWL